jgi:hypothetical protein
LDTTGSELSRDVFLTTIRKHRSFRAERMHVNYAA